MAKVFSMLSNDQLFVIYGEKKGDGLVKASKTDKSILIKGGANVQNRLMLNEHLEPFIVTEVSSDDLKLLQTLPSFNRKVERGFLVIGSTPKSDVKDKSAQLKEKDVKAKPHTAKAKTKINTSDDL